MPVLACIIPWTIRCHLDTVHLGSARARPRRRATTAHHATHAATRHDTTRRGATRRAAPQPYYAVRLSLQARALTRQQNKAGAYFACGTLNRRPSLASASGPRYCTLPGRMVWRISRAIGGKSFSHADFRLGNLCARQIVWPACWLASIQSAAARCSGCFSHFNLLDRPNPESSVCSLATASVHAV